MAATCEHQARVRAIFDARAGDWAQGYGPGRDYRHHSFQRRRANVLALLAEGVERGRILDAGCGTGDYAEPLLARGFEVWCVDASAAMIARVEARFGGGAVRAAVGTLEQLPYPAGLFDGAVCAGVFDYLAQPGAALAELARVLRRGGAAVVTAPNAWSPFAAMDAGLYRAVRAGGALLEACGLFERLAGRPRAALEVPHRRYRPSRFIAAAAAAGLRAERVRFCCFGSFALNRAVPGAVALSTLGERFGNHPVLGRLGVTAVMRLRKAA